MPDNMNFNVQAEILLQRIVRDEIAKRDPVDVTAVEELVSKRLRITEEGRIVVRNPEGGDMVGKSQGFVCELPEFLDTLSREKPDLFKNTAPVVNPFKKGPHFNMTKAFELLRTNRELGLRFAAEAGIDLGVTRV